MTPDPKVFELVRVMTPAEKRYYTLFSAREEMARSNTLILFEILCEAVELFDQYDEQWVRQQLTARGHHAIVRHLSSIKDDLYKNILRVMRVYHARKTTVSRLRDMLEAFRFMLGRGLYPQAGKMLREAKKLAKTYENYRLLLEILECEKQLIYDQSEKNLAQKIKRVLKEISDTMQCLQVEVSLQILYDRMFTQLRLCLTGKKVDPVFLQKIIRHPLLQDNRSIRTFVSWRLYYGVFALYHRILNEMEQCCDHESRLVELWRENPHQVQDNVQAFMRILSNFSGLCLRLGRYRHYRQAIAWLKTIECQTADDHAEQFQDVAYLTTLYFLAVGQFAPPTQELDCIREGFREHEGKVNPSRILAISYNLTILFFIGGRYRATLVWLKDILDRKKYEVRLDLRIHAHLLAPIIHYQLGDIGMVENCCRAAGRFIKSERRKECEAGMHSDADETDCSKAGVLHPYERKLLTFLKKLPMEREKEVGEAKIVQQSILDYLQQHTGQPPLVQEVLLWVESIITGKPTAVLFREQRGDSARETDDNDDNAI